VSRPGIEIVSAAAEAMSFTRDKTPQGRFSGSAPLAMGECPVVEAQVSNTLELGRVVRDQRDPECRACAAMKRSLAPIIAPGLFRSARISA
jgi:hypothetical protein